MRRCSMQHAVHYHDAVLRWRVRGSWLWGISSVQNCTAMLLLFCVDSGEIRKHLFLPTTICPKAPMQMYEALSFCVGLCVAAVSVIDGRRSRRSH